MIHSVQKEARSKLDIVIRAAEAADAERIGQICYTSFEAIACAHNFPPDWPAVEPTIAHMRRKLVDPVIRGFIAQRDDQVIGAAFLNGFSRMAAVGPVLVDPGAQDHGTGRRLMRAVLDQADREGYPGVRLVQAAYHGRAMALYASLGFTVREPLANLQGTPIRSRPPDFDVRPAADGDVPECSNLCVRVHGFAREHELRAGLAQSTAVVVEHAGRICGYSAGLGFFGHAVAESTGALKALIASAPAYLGPGLIVPTRNAELFGWCLEHGLRIVQPLTLMTLGEYREPAGAYLPSIAF